VVMTMRYLLGGIATGIPAEALTVQAREGDDSQLCDPGSAYRISGSTRAKEFLTGYITNFDGKLPVATLDLQKFDDATWNHQADLRVMDKGLNVTWEKRMGWWGGTGAGQGGESDNSRDFFITGLDLQGQQGVDPASPHWTSWSITCRPPPPAFPDLEAVLRVPSDDDVVVQCNADEVGHPP